MWGGDRDGLPFVHDSEEKRKYTTSVDVFNILKSTIVKIPTTGEPHNGTMYYSSCNIGNDIYYFGGSCDISDCFHNYLSVINTETYKWRHIVCDNKPMKKIICSMTSLNIDGKDYVIVIGGAGPLPVNTPSHSQYMPGTKDPSRCTTNEIHMMCISEGIYEYHYNSVNSNACIVNR